MLKPTVQIKAKTLKILLLLQTNSPVLHLTKRWIRTNSGVLLLPAPWTIVSFICINYWLVLCMASALSDVLKEMYCFPQSPLKGNPVPTAGLSPRTQVVSGSRHTSAKVLREQHTGQHPQGSTHRSPATISATWAVCGMAWLKASAVPALQSRQRPLGLNCCAGCRVLHHAQCPSSLRLPQSVWAKASILPGERHVEKEPCTGRWRRLCIRASRCPWAYR